MCNSYTHAWDPIPTNHHFKAAEIFSHPAGVAEILWYGILQEYTPIQKFVKWPFGWPVCGFPRPLVFYFIQFCYTLREMSHSRVAWRETRMFADFTTLRLVESIGYSVNISALNFPTLLAFLNILEIPVFRECKLN